MFGFVGDVGAEISTNDAMPTPKKANEFLKISNRKLKNSPQKAIYRREKCGYIAKIENSAKYTLGRQISRLLSEKTQKKLTKNENLNENSPKNPTDRRQNFRID
uniref:Uncharacterized protein n=1 Tax=Romanomermis culicivorax TaxID=13658 RepID=A0A915HT59_ROMCU